MGKRKGLDIEGNKVDRDKPKSPEVRVVQEGVNPLNSEKEGHHVEGVLDFKGDEVDLLHNSNINNKERNYADDIVETVDALLIDKVFMIHNEGKEDRWLITSKKWDEVLNTLKNKLKDYMILKIDDIVNDNPSKSKKKKLNSKEEIEKDMAKARKILEDEKKYKGEVKDITNMVDNFDDVIESIKNGQKDINSDFHSLLQEDMNKEFDEWGNKKSDKETKKLYKTVTKAKSYLVIAKNYEEAKQITEDFLNKDDGDFEYNRIVINVELLAENTEIPRGNSVNDNSIKILLPLGL